MNSAFSLFLATIFVWVVGLLYFRQIYYFVRGRTDRVTFFLFPFSKTFKLRQDGIVHWLVRVLHAFLSIVYVGIGIPITLFFMGMLPFALIQKLINS